MSRPPRPRRSWKQGLVWSVRHLCGTASRLYRSVSPGPDRLQILERRLDRMEELRSILVQTRSDVLRIETGLDAVRPQRELSDAIHDELANYHERLDRVEAVVPSLEDVRSILMQTRTELLRIETELDAVRSQRELGDRIHDELTNYRASDEYQRLYEEEWPLVTIGVATYNRSHLLIGRCLPSILQQDYLNLEVVVVGDGCTDQTAQAIRELGDPRIRFLNLPEHSVHPEDPDSYWLTGGGPAGNHVRALARGDLITQLDDDDEYRPDRISKLVSLLKEKRAEVVWHPFWAEHAPGTWVLNEAGEFRLGQVTTGSVLYRSWFKRFDWHPNAYRGREPADWYRFRKMKFVGARMARCPEPLLRHYRERNQPYLNIERNS